MSRSLISIVPQDNFNAEKPNKSAIFEFEDFRLEADHLMLYRNGESVSLAPKQVETLLALVERGGEIVGKGELMDRLWANAVVEESNLTQNIHLLRKVLGDTSDGQPMIETLRRRGYRFNGQVTSLGPRSSPNGVGTPLTKVEPLVDVPTPAVHEPVVAPGQKSIAGINHRRIIVAAAIVVLIIGAVAAALYYRRIRTAAVTGSRTIAVLPFRPIDAATRDDLYEIGIADSLILKINAMKGLIARPLSAVRKYGDLDQDALVAGQEQKVDFVLASSYQSANGKVRVTANLINVATGQIEATYKTEKEFANVFALQDAIATDLGNSLSARFVTSPIRPLRQRGTDNETAYRLYLQGMYLTDSRRGSDAQGAIGFLEQAVQLDPNYAQAWAGNAYAHRTAANLGRKVDIDLEYRKSMEAVQRALALDPNLADAHSVWCENKMYYEYDFAGAERECRTAIEMDPNSSLAHQTYSRFLSSRGRHDEAIAEVKTAIDLDPASLFSQRLYGNNLQYARRYDEAVVQFKRVIEMDQKIGSSYPYLYMTLALQGKYAEAFDWLIRSQTALEKDEATIRGFQNTYRSAGWLGIMRERVKNFEGGTEVYYHGATYNAQAGNIDQAFAYLERSFARHELWMAYLKIDPLIDPLRNDQRYPDLVRRVERN